MDRQEEINKLKQRIDILETRIVLLEDANIKIKEKPLVQEEVVERPITVNEKHTQIVNNTAKVMKQKIDLEKQIGQVWLPRIFIFVLLMGVIWAFKAASTNGFITEPIRVILGYLFSIVLYWFGARQIKQKRKALGLVLLGGTVTLLVLTTFAAHNLYVFFPPTVAFLLNIAWISLGLFLSQKHKSEPLSIFVGIGGYLIPFLIESTNPNVYVFAGYELLLYLGLFLFAIKKSYLTLYYVSLFLLQIVYFIYSIYTHGRNDEILIFGVLTQHFVLLWYFIFKSDKIHYLLISIFGNFVLTIAWIYIVYEDIGDWFALGLFLLYGIIAYSLRNKNKTDKMAVSSTIAAFSLFVFLMHSIETDGKAGFIVMEGTMMLFLGLHLKSSIKQVSGFLVFLIGSGLILEQEIEVIFSSRTLNWLLLLLTLLAMHVLYERYKGAYIKDFEKIILNGTIGAFLLLVLYFITQITNLITIDLSLNVAQLSLSFSWAIYGVVAIFYGIYKQIKGIRLFGIGMLFVILLKLIFIDLPTLSIVFRAILFIGLGIIGVTVSRLFYSKKSE